MEPRRDKESEFRELGREKANPENKRGRVLDSLRHIFGGNRSAETYLSESVLEKLTPIWDTTIVPVLMAEFGAEASLNVIFYAGSVPGQLIMEIWDPRYADRKPSQVFKLGGLADYETRRLPQERSKATIMSLEDWNSSFPI
ncbi:MAG: hypothetical protein F6J93_31590 [Oscillatoria sp. SIO1A7]|nr:hypothetical protein [Oscillatoria sp. SIO1A7]